jgi:YD repeat-containing protein
MSSSGKDPSAPDPKNLITTFVYDAGRGSVIHGTDGFQRFTYDAVGRCTGSTDARGEATPCGPGLSAALPTLVHTFEFRLVGTETQEQTLTLSGMTGRAAVAIAAVRLSLTRTGEAATEVSPIGGIEVHAELRDGAAVCRAGLSEFAAGDLIVVQVDVALYLLR